MSIGAIVIELRVFNKKEKKKMKKKKNMDKMGKLFFCYNFAYNGYFSERFGTQLIFDMYCAVNSLKAH